ncbi:MAG: isocitrate lyase/PEP mutase family protein [Candidatus Omnitrophica bacterium]|nr:isocitrate lyase/PEP mutase family protein [Candidatus Omnitrophota bacterium]
MNANNSNAEHFTAGMALRQALDANEFVIAPGCYDALSARIAESHGFGAVYMSGLAVTASMLARPDLELLGMAEMVRQAGLITSAVGIPVIADADTGYGGLASVERTTRAYIQAGVAAIHLEDQASPKRCGQMGGVRLLDPDTMMAKLRVAVEARADSDMLIIGRTDAFRVAGIKEAVSRANLYAQTGVDVLFVDGVTLPDDFRHVRAAVKGRLLASIVEVDAPAKTQAKELKEMGYSIAIFAISSIQATAGALNRLMADIKTNGTTNLSFKDMLPYSPLNKLVGIEHYHQLWDRLSQD